MKKKNRDQSQSLVGRESSRALTTSVSPESTSRDAEIIANSFFARIFSERAKLNVTTPVKPVEKPIIDI